MHTLLIVLPNILQLHQYTLILAKQYHDDNNIIRFLKALLSYKYILGIIQLSNFDVHIQYDMLALVIRLENKNWHCVYSYI